MSMSFLWHRQMICSIIAKKWQKKTNPHIIIFHKNNNVVIPFLGVAEQNESDFSVKIEESLVLGIGTAGVSLTQYYDVFVSFFDKLNIS